MTKKPTEVMTAVVDLLSPLTSDDRQRVIQAAMLMLGESPTIAAAKTKTGAGPDDNDDRNGEWPAKARTWAKQNSLTPDVIEEVFHKNGGAYEVIVEPPGKSQREKTINAYILTGIASFLASGETAFDDKSARELCITSGCYSGTNHATYIKDRGNDFTGSREAGWSLTSPGLKHAASLIKGLSATGD